MSCQVTAPIASVLISKPYLQHNPWVLARRGSNFCLIRNDLFYRPLALHHLWVAMARKRRKGVCRECGKVPSYLGFVDARLLTPNRSLRTLLVMWMLVLALLTISRGPSTTDLFIRDRNSMGPNTISASRFRFPSGSSFVIAANVKTLMLHGDK